MAEIELGRGRGLTLANLEVGEFGGRRVLDVGESWTWASLGSGRVFDLAEFGFWRVLDVDEFSTRPNLDFGEFWTWANFGSVPVLDVGEF